MFYTMITERTPRTHSKPAKQISITEANGAAIPISQRTSRTQHESIQSNILDRYWHGNFINEIFIFPLLHHYFFILLFFGLWLWGVGLGLWGVAFGLWSVGLGLWGVALGLWGVAFGLWGVGLGLWGVAFGLWGVGLGLRALGLGHDQLSFLHWRHWLRHPVPSHRCIWAHLL
ncbi:MAG: DUF4175 domain-containing protein [Gammaproteobacteria bacterium]|nr:DUF4175 domain-containing protein [Gammaproteobacteria bacterium]